MEDHGPVRSSQCRVFLPHYNRAVWGKTALMWNRLLLLEIYQKESCWLKLPVTAASASVLNEFQGKRKLKKNEAPDKALIAHLFLSIAKILIRIGSLLTLLKHWEKSGKHDTKYLSAEVYSWTPKGRPMQRSNFWIRRLQHLWLIYGENGYWIPAKSPCSSSVVSSW